jgi:hypothetical protein
MSYCAFRKNQRADMTALWANKSPQQPMILQYPTVFTFRLETSYTKKRSETPKLTLIQTGGLKCLPCSCFQILEEFHQNSVRDAKFQRPMVFEGRPPICMW